MNIRLEYSSLVIAQCRESGFWWWFREGAKRSGMSGPSSFEGTLALFLRSGSYCYYIIAIKFPGSQVGRNAGSQNRSSALRTICAAHPAPAGATQSAAPVVGLMEGFVAGDCVALANAFDLYSFRVYSLAMRILRDPALAEEVTQDVFMAAWRHRARFDRNRGSMSAWLLATTRNRAIDLTRGRSGKHRLEGEIPLDTQSSLDVEETVLTQLDRHAIGVALSALPYEQGYAIERAYFYGQSASEIALDAGVPLSTIKGRMRLGLTKLARDIGLRSATVTEGA